MDEEIEKSEDTLKILLFLIRRLVKLKDKVYKINRNCYGITRDIENMIHFGREKLSKAFIWLDKAYYQLKDDIKEKKEYQKKWILRKPCILDDWHWFLIKYHMILFRPFKYMELIRKNKKARLRRQLEEIGIKFYE